MTTIEGVDRRVTVLEADRKHLATLADLERIKGELEDHSNSQFRWLVGLLVVLAVAAIGTLLRSIG